MAHRAEKKCQRRLLWARHIGVMPTCNNEATSKYHRIFQIKYSPLYLCDDCQADASVMETAHGCCPVPVEIRVKSGLTLEAVR